MLQRSGAIVRVAASAVEALALLASWKPSILLADVGMPGQDGYDHIRTIRSTECKDNALLPAVALTAYASAKDRTDALVAGFQEHMTKPVEPAALIKVIAALVKKTTASVSN